MPVIPFGEYRPDLSDYEAQTEQGRPQRGSARRRLRAVPEPRGDLAASLGAQCRGAFAAYKTDGSVVVFAATSTDLYQLNNTTYGWTKVSLGGGPYAAVTAASNGQFVQFNNLVIAVQANVAPQVFDISSSTAFANLAGSPPQARYVDVVGRFVVLTGLLSNAEPGPMVRPERRERRNSWTAGINSSDSQDLPDGGITRGIAGGESGVIFQDNAIRRMTYLPGDPRVFQIEKNRRRARHLWTLSLVRSGASVFFYSLKGFHRIDPGGPPTPIGRERVDRTFFTDLDATQPQLFMGAADPRSSRILWVYKSVNGVTNQFDKALCYDPVLDKFSPLRFPANSCSRWRSPASRSSKSTR
jgi:hypothetical protein